MKRTALHIASETGHAPIVNALLTNNANFDALDCEGQLIINKICIVIYYL
jgi:ankyrin repeat protein